MQVNNDDDKSITGMIKDWDNDNRMNFYFERMKPRALDEEEWDTKMNFWLPLIKQSLRKKESPRLSFSLSELKNVFRRDGTTPSCIEDVLCASYASRELVNTDSILHPQSVGSLPWRMVSAVFSYFWPSSTLPSGRYCFVNHLREQSDYLYETVLQNCHSFIDRIVPYAKIRKLSSLPDYDVDLLLAQLKNEKKVVELKTDIGKVYKFAPSGKEVQLVTELDGTVAKLKWTDSILEARIAAIEAASKKKEGEVLDLLRKKKKKLAIYPLRLKRRFDQKHEQLMAIKGNIETTLHGMENVSSNIEILDSMKAGAQALKQLQKNVNIDSVEETMDETREVLEENEEVENALSEFLLGEGEMKSVEEEYNKMLQDLQLIEKDIAEKKRTNY